MNKEKNTISAKVLDKIKKENVKPIPKWHFLLEHGFLWLLLLVLIIAGAIALGISIFELTDAEWGLRPLLGFGLFDFFLRVFPYFWVVIFLMVCVLAYYNFVSTPKGYKYPKYQIILFGVLIVIVTGAAVYYLGLAKKARNLIHDQAPLVERFMQNKDKFYNLPDKGLLVGEISEIDGNSIVVISPDRQPWQVNTQDVVLPEGKNLAEGQKVKIVGEKTSENQFTAKDIRPWQLGDPLRLKDFMDNKNGGNGPNNGNGSPPTDRPPPKPE